LLAAVEGLSNAEAVRRLGERCGLARDHTESPSPLSPRRAERLLAGFLEGRGWDPAAAAEAGLHVVLGDHGRPRVRFPCFYGAELVWWQDRAIGEALPKWLNPAGKRPALFNANSLRLAAERDGELLVVEGPSDAMAVLSTYEAPAVVGVPGAGSFSPDWTPAFSGLRRVWVVADNDGAGMKLRERVRRLLGPVVPHVVDLFVPEAHKDLDDWRRGCGTEKPELFGEALEAAFGAAEEAAAA
jgi:5S rRNA maturation endonuclease (ribonuclease M5)